MIWPFSWFTRKDNGPEDYERVLATLDINIQQAQTRLSELRLRERRSTLWATIYALGGWGLYIVLWWGFLPNVRLWQMRSQYDRDIQGMIKFLPVVVGPIIIVFIRRIVQMWYTRKGDYEEKQLKSLMAEQRTKVEEIKKKTNYYSTKHLLDRYDAPSKMAAPNTPQNNQLRQRNVQKQQQQQQGSPATPVMPGGRAPQATPLGQRPLPLSSPQQQTPNPRVQLLQANPQPMTPPRKQWYDKLADALLGEDEASNASVHSRYALICESCFAHNGLVRESEWDDMKYVCPKCGHFNPSPRMKREGFNPSVYSSRAPSLNSNRDQLSLPSSPANALFDASVSPPNSPEGKRTSFGRSPLAHELSGADDRSEGRGRSLGRPEPVDEEHGEDEQIQQERADSPMKIDA